MWNLSKAEWNPAKSQSVAGQAIIKDYSSDPAAKPSDQKDKDQGLNLCHGGFYAATATWRGNTPKVAGEDAEDSRLDGLEREFSEVRQMKGQRIAPSAQLDSIQNPKR